MPKLTWDAVEERLYETGVDRGVVYPKSSTSTPAAWNGLISVTDSPSGAEATPLYANNRKYLNLLSVEEYAFSIEAYMSPEEFDECDGSAQIVPGVHVRQQKRTPFDFTYRNLIGNDTEGTAHGYKLHLIYNALAAPAESTNTSINDSPEAKTMSWECSTTPVEIEGYEASAHIEIDSTKIDAEKLAALEAMLYGSESTEPKMPTPAELIELLGEGA